MNSNNTINFTLYKIIISNEGTSDDWKTLSQEVNSKPDE
jgi:hypothetical protein